MNEFLTTNEAAEILGLHKETVLRYAREGKLKTVPDNPHFPIRRNRLFYKEDVERYQKENQPGGWTVEEVANHLNISKSMVFHLISQNKLDAKKEPYRATGRYVIPNDALEEFVRKNNSRLKSANIRERYYDGKKGVYLFQPFVQTGTQQIARIISLDKSGILLRTEAGEEISLDLALNQNYKPIQPLVKKTYIQKKGTIKFRFPFSSDFNSRIYDVIDWLMNELGHSNMYIQWDLSKEYINVEVRSALLPSNKTSDFTIILQRCCTHGQIIDDGQRIFLQSDQRYIAAYIHKDIKEWVEQKAKEHQCSEGEYLEKVLLEKMEKKFSGWQDENYLED